MIEDAIRKIQVRVTEITQIEGKMIDDAIFGHIQRIADEEGIKIDVQLNRDFIIKAFQNHQKNTVKQKWTSVHDRLPDKDTLVLCVGAKGGMFLGYIRFLYGNDKTAYVRVPNARSGRYAAFWMPLPEAPRMDGE